MCESRVIQSRPHLRLSQERPWELVQKSKADWRRFSEGISRGTERYKALAPPWPTGSSSLMWVLCATGLDNKSFPRWDRCCCHLHDDGQRGEQNRQTGPALVRGHNPLKVEETQSMFKAAETWDSQVMRNSLTNLAGDLLEV